MSHPRNLRNTILFTSLVVLAASACVYAYLFEETSSLVGKTIAAHEALLSAQASKLQGQEIVSLFDSSSAKRARIKSFFVPSENAVAVIQAIESVGQSSGASVAISSINAVPPVDKSPIGHVSAAVVINGTWTDVMRAVTLFEDLPYDSTMSGLGLRYSGPSEDKTGAHHWQAGFSLSVDTIQNTP